jgi:hypothetical protein
MERAALSPAERRDRIERYAAGPARLTAALERVAPAARQWRPGAGQWSVHEVVCHCADAETNGAARIRYLLAEKEPVLEGYDQDVWATTLDYHAQPLEPALAVVAAVRAHTAALLRRLPDEAWRREGRHTELGRYTAEDWLRIYADHLDVHARQIETAAEAWAARSASRTTAGIAGRPG